MFAARDALGCQELHYILDRNYCMLATRLNSLLEHPAVQPKLNETKIAGYLALQWGDDVNTFYDSICHLPPAYSLLVTAESSHLWRYWDVDPDKTIRYARQEQYGEHYRELIKESLRARLRSTAPLGISLSGGLDSSSLTCLAAEVLSDTGAPQGRLGSYSYVFDAFPNCDERAYIQPVIDQASRIYPIHPTKVNGDSLWPRPFDQDWLILRDYPGQDPYYYLVQATLQAAQANGARVMLSGFYGDDLYSGTDTWFADLLLSGRFRQAARILTRFHRFVNLKQDLLDGGLRAMIPAGIKKGYRTLRPRPPAEWVEWIHPQLAVRTDLVKLDNLAGAHPKFRLPGQQNRYSALLFTGYPESLTGFQNIAYRNGMECIFPFADRLIVEFMLGLPSEQVALPGISRRILREALTGRLPEFVRQRQGKTGLLDLFNKGIYKENFSEIQKIFQRSQVLERGFIQKDWLAGELNRRFRTVGGSILWLVLGLENWLHKYW